MSLITDLIAKIEQDVTGVQTPLSGPVATKVKENLILLAQAVQAVQDSIGGFRALDTTADLGTTEATIENEVLIVKNNGIFIDTDVSGTLDGQQCFAGVGGRFWQRIAAPLPSQAGTSANEQIIQADTGSFYWAFGVRGDANQYKTLDIYLQRGNGDENALPDAADFDWLEFRLDASRAQKPRLLLDIEDTTGTDIIYTTVEDNLWYIEFSGAARWEISGLPIDNDAEQLMALDAEGKVCVVEKSSIAGSTITRTVLADTILPNDGSYTENAAFAFSMLPRTVTKFKLFLSFFGGSTSFTFKTRLACSPGGNAELEESISFKVTPQGNDNLTANTLLCKAANWSDNRLDSEITWDGMTGWINGNGFVVEIDGIIRNISMVDTKTVQFGFFIIAGIGDARLQPAAGSYCESQVILTY